MVDQASFSSSPSTAVASCSVFVHCYFVYHARRTNLVFLGVDLLSCVYERFGSVLQRLFHSIFGAGFLETGTFPVTQPTVSEHWIDQVKVGRKID